MADKIVKTTVDRTFRQTNLTSESAEYLASAKNFASPRSN
jgi:hypothetical protein